MKGGVILFRGTGAAARRYVEADRSKADEYYLEAGDAIAEYVVLNSSGDVTATSSLSADEYEGWVNWTNPITAEQMGTPRLPGEGRRGSPMFAEMVVNAPKSLSVAAALHPDVSDALDQAQQDAVAEIQHWLAQHTVTRVGPRGAQEVVPVEGMQTVGITHKTSRAGDPHRHIHLQIGTRVQAVGRWRALDTAALFKQQGAIRALGTAVIAAHPQLAQTLAEHGLTLDHVTGEVTQLEPFNAVMSKRSVQIRRNLDQLEAEWEADHPGKAVGPALSARLQGIAWAHQRPGKKPADLKNEQWWAQELTDAGYTPATLRQQVRRASVALDKLSVQEVASRALDRCAASGSAWTLHTVTEQVTRITTEHGVQATPAELREFIGLASKLAIGDCFSILPPGAPAPEHVAHLTSLHVVATETALRDLLTGSIPVQEPEHPNITEAAHAAGLDAGQTVAAAAVASSDPLVIVEGAAGSGKTIMLGVAIGVAHAHGRRARVVAPTLRAAQVAEQELGVPATSVAALVHAHGFRWNTDGVWTRLAPGDTDFETGHIYDGPPKSAVLTAGERVIVDEAGMLDQDTAHALFTVTAEAGTTVALVGDRAQLSAVGRGGVLDMAAHIRGRSYDMAELHRFTDPEYADLTLRIRDGDNPAIVFDQLHQLGLIHLHADGDSQAECIAAHAGDDATVTVATNEEATGLNEHIRAGRVERGHVDDSRTVTGSDGLAIGAGDRIQTRKNNSNLGVANRQNWIVQHVTDHGTLYAKEAGTGQRNPHTVRLPADYVAEHAHLSYASTAYGVQGVTVNESHTVLSDALDAAGVYVAMTRGRHTNHLHVIAETVDDARTQFIEAMARDRADRGLDHATVQAVEEVRGLITDGPASIVAAELARLDQQCARAERRAVRWEQIAGRLEAQRATHQAENDQDAVVLQQVEEHADLVRAKVTQPLIARAEADGTDYLDAVKNEAVARERLTSSGRIGRRKTRTEHHRTSEHAKAASSRVRDAWGALPRNTETLTAWAREQATRRAENDPQMIAATQQIETAQVAQAATHERHEQERKALLINEYGADQVGRDWVRARLTNPQRQAQTARTEADTAGHQAAQLRGLPLNEAAERIEAQRNAEDKARQLVTERTRRPHAPVGHHISRSDPGRDRPELGL